MANHPSPVGDAVAGRASVASLMGDVSEAKPKSSRLSLDMEPALHRRIKLAAVTERMSIRDWMLRLAMRELDQGQSGAWGPESIPAPASALAAPLPTMAAARPSAEDLAVVDRSANGAMERFMSVDRALRLVRGASSGAIGFAKGRQATLHPGLWHLLDGQPAGALLDAETGMDSSHAERKPCAGSSACS